MVVSMIFAAGAFAGVLVGSGMVAAMAEVLSQSVPESAAGLLPLIVALTAMPLSMVLPPDAYYFGLLPVLASTYASFGGIPEVIGRAALLGHTTTGSPISPLNPSTFVLLSASGVDLIHHQRFVFFWAYGSTIVMTLIALATGAIVLRL
jgi:CitMHS family citrate-Mg2+:H+ or citrate-Ca2+:H+ symporter